MAYDIAEARKRLKEKNTRRRDPNEFVPAKVEGDQEVNYRFFVLPPLQEGDKSADGPASKSMDVFYLKNGAHYVGNQFHACPRVTSDDECDLCSLGFDLMGECPPGEAGKKQRSAISKDYMPAERFACNIYFPNSPSNPEELRGRVMWYNASKKVEKIMEDCLMRDDAGDPEDPKAFGFFYDENNAYLFQLCVKHQGGYNNYDTSRFLSNGTMPIVATKDTAGKIAPHTAKIKELLDKRFDLFTKFEEPNPAKMAELAQRMVNGKTGGSDGGFDQSDPGAGTTQAGPASRPRLKPTTTTPAAKPVAEEVLVEDAGVDLSAEAGEIVETPVAPKAVAKAPVKAAPAKPAPKPVAKAVAAPVVSPVEEAATEAEPAVDAELESLMKQIDGE